MKAAVAVAGPFPPEEAGQPRLAVEGFEGVARGELLDFGGEGAIRVLVDGEEALRLVVYPVEKGGDLVVSVESLSDLEV